MKNNIRTTNKITTNNQTNNINNNTNKFTTNNYSNNFNTNTTTPINNKFRFKGKYTNKNLPIKNTASKINKTTKFTKKSNPDAVYKSAIDTIHSIRHTFGNDNSNNNNNMISHEATNNVHGEEIGVSELIVENSDNNEFNNQHFFINSLDQQQQHQQKDNRSHTREDHDISNGYINNNNNNTNNFQRIENHNTNINFTDQRLKLLFSVLDIFSIKPFFDEYLIFSFNDLLLLGKEDLIEMGIPLAGRNRILNFVNSYKASAKNYDKEEIIGFLNTNKQFVININALFHGNSNNYNMENLEQSNNPEIIPNNLHNNNVSLSDDLVNMASNIDRQDVQENNHRLIGHNNNTSNTNHSNIQQQEQTNEYHNEDSNNNTINNQLENHVEESSQNLVIEKTSTNNINNMNSMLNNTNISNISHKKPNNSNLNTNNNNTLFTYNKDKDYEKINSDADKFLKGYKDHKNNAEQRSKTLKALLSKKNTSSINQNFNTNKNNPIELEEEERVLDEELKKSNNLYDTTFNFFTPNTNSNSNTNYTKKKKINGNKILNRNNTNNVGIYNMVSNTPKSHLNFTNTNTTNTINIAYNKKNRINTNSKTNSNINPIKQEINKIPSTPISHNNLNNLNNINSMNISSTPNPYYFTNKPHINKNNNTNSNQLDIESELSKLLSLFKEKQNISKDLDGKNDEIEKRKKMIQMIEEMEIEENDYDNDQNISAENIDPENSYNEGDINNESITSSNTNVYYKKKLGNTTNNTTYTRNNPMNNKISNAPWNMKK